MAKDFKVYNSIQSNYTGCTNLILYLCIGLEGKGNTDSLKLAL
jgi:hypothetical protein